MESGSAVNGSETTPGNVMKMSSLFVRLLPKVTTMSGSATPVVPDRVRPSFEYV